MREQQRIKYDAEIRRDQLIRFHRLRPDHPRVLEEDKKLQRSAALIDGLRKDQQKYEAVWNESAGLVSAIDRFIRSLPSGSELAPYSGPSPKLSKGENCAQSIERCRRQLQELLVNKKKLSTAAIPSPRSKQIVRGEIERQAALGRPDVTPVVHHGAAILWPIMSNFKGERLVAASGQAQLDGLAVLTWLLKSQLIEALEKEIDAITDDTTALSESDRSKRLGGLERDILAAEREEEFFIRRARDEGANVPRRRNASPLAVLQLTLDAS